MFQRYSELSVKNVWKYVKDTPDLMRYFPNYLNSQIPDRQFMYSIISSTYPNALKVLINDAKKKISLVENNDDNEIIEMKQEIKEAIMGVYLKEVSTFVFDYKYSNKRKSCIYVKEGSKAKDKETSS